MDKQIIYKQLPIQIKDFKIRIANREDIDIRCKWPSYPAPYEAFNSSSINRSKEERDERYNNDENDNNRIVLSVDNKNDLLIGTFVLYEIDWKNYIINNMGIRLHSDWCDKGYGTIILSEIIKWCFDNQFMIIRLDVRKTNERAIKSYKKAGFKTINNMIKGEDEFVIMEIQNK